MSTYHATTPPQGTTCQTEHCCSTALVRLVNPRPSPAGGSPSPGNGHGSGHGAGHGAGHDGPATWDTCELHWPKFRDRCTKNGHGITDGTGELAELAEDFPAWHIFASDTGRLYAARPMIGGQGTTVDAYLTGQLRQRMAEEERTAACG